MSNPLVPITELPFFKTAPEPILQLLPKLFKTITLDKDYSLYEEFSPATHFYIITKGLIIVKRKSAEKEQSYCYALFKTGDVFGEMEIILNCPRIATCSTLKKTTLLAISKTDFMLLMQQSKWFLTEICYLQTLHKHTLLEYCRYSITKPTEFRLLIWLLWLYSEIKDISDDDTVSLTQHFIAEVSGISRQRISSHLKEWEMLGWITLSYGNITIKNLTKLLDLFITYQPEYQAYLNNHNNPTINNKELTPLGNPFLNFIVNRVHRPLEEPLTEI